MVSSANLLLMAFTVFSALFTITQAFCIYNKMTPEVGTIDVYDPIHEDSAASFKKVISAGGKECCHYSNTDCNPSGIRNMAIYFHGWLNFNGLAREGHKQVMKCDAGGALIIYGTSKDDARAVCNQSTGVVLYEALLGDI